MENSFDSSKYINHLAKELINNFSFSSAATTPVLVGSAREKEIIRKLELLLPSFVKIGSGCVIDSYGNTSKQIDIIIYEKDFCPVFSINDSPETTYYPCEAVIAVGEVKSSLNNKELEDIFKKIDSVKSLKRYCEIGESIFDGSVIPFRKFGSKTHFIGSKEESYDQENKFLDQIFGFAFCGELNVSQSNIAENYKNLMKIYPFNRQPSLITILNHGLILYLNSKTNYIHHDPKLADSLYVSDKQEGNFEFLLSNLVQVVNNHRTVNAKFFSRYLSSIDSGIPIKGISVKI